MWKWIGTPLPTSEVSLAQINLHIICVYHTPEIGVLTGIYFVECQVPDCPRRYTFYITAFYRGQWLRYRSLHVRVELNVTVSLIWHKNIWWWGSSSGSLENVEYTFIAITPRFILTQSDRVCKFYFIHRRDPI